METCQAKSWKEDLIVTFKFGKLREDGVNLNPDEIRLYYVKVHLSDLLLSVQKGWIDKEIN